MANWQNPSKPTVKKEVPVKKEEKYWNMANWQNQSEGAEKKELPVKKGERPWYTGNWINPSQMVVRKELPVKEEKKMENYWNTANWQNQSEGAEKKDLPVKKGERHWYTGNWINPSQMVVRKELPVKEEKKMENYWNMANWQNHSRVTVKKELPKELYWNIANWQTPSKVAVKKELVLKVKKEDKTEKIFQKDFGSRLRKAKGALLIREIGHKLHCTLITITKAMVLFHKVERNPKFNSSCLNSVACLFLAIKLCDEAVTPDEIVLKSYHIIMDSENTPNPARPDPTFEEFQDMKKNLCHAEHAISKSMSFKLECTLAHIYVYKFLVFIQQTVPDVTAVLMVAMSTTVTKLLCTYYLCDGCIDFSADEIAAAALKFIYLFFCLSSSSSSSMKEIFEKNLAAVPNKSKIDDILDELVVVSDVSTTLKNI